MVSCLFYNRIKIWWRRYNGNLRTSVLTFFIAWHVVDSAFQYKRFGLALLNLISTSKDGIENQTLNDDLAWCWRENCNGKQLAYLISFISCISLWHSPLLLVSYIDNLFCLFVMRRLSAVDKGNADNSRDHEPDGRNQADSYLRRLLTLAGNHSRTRHPLNQLCASCGHAYGDT